MYNHLKSLFRIFLMHLNALLSENYFKGENHGTKCHFRYFYKWKCFPIHGLSCKLTGDYRKNIFFQKKNLSYVPQISLKSGKKKMGQLISGNNAHFHNTYCSDFLLCIVDIVISLQSMKIFFVNL